ncbi:hypothetical protein GX411_02395 [Candidatus Fermentibacteria bacterium]|nr:hypothetical protein [Candidatus Fermentibacteria bacterium]
MGFQHRADPAAPGLDWAALLLCLAAAVVLMVLSAGIPVSGDAWGYSYRTARWIADNGMTPIPCGQGRGEQGMGHPTAFYWTWALLMRIAGDTVAVAHVLPSATFCLALWAAWRLGHAMAGRACGFWTAACLLASPLFLSQALQPLQETGFTAFAALAMERYLVGRNTQAAVMTTVAAVFREQAVLLAASFALVELLHEGTGKPGRILVHAMPLGVILVTGLGNLAATGMFFNKIHFGAPSALRPDWLAFRTRLFAGHLLAADGRWIPLVSALALVLAGQARRTPSATSLLLLLSPALLFPPARLAFLAVMAAAGTLAIARRGSLPDRPIFAMILFVLMMIAFHVLIVKIAPDPALDLYRYVLGALPAVLALPLAVIRRRGGVRLLHPVGAILLVSGVLGCFRIDPFQPDSTPAGTLASLDTRRAVLLAAASADTAIAPETEADFFTNPSLGYIDRPFPVRVLGTGPALCGDAAYSVLVPPTHHGDPWFERTLEEILPAGAFPCTLATWVRGPLVTEVLLIGADE